MRNGDKFPSIVLFGSKEKSWIGDGWHRLMAADQCGKKVIWADLKEGGRIEALKFALNANAKVGLKRSNPDKQRCVQIAIAEFPKLSNGAIAELCGVSDMMVSTHRPVDSNNLGVEKRIGLDGREYRVRHNGSKKERQDEEDRQDIEDAERILADPDDKIIPFTQEDSTEIDYSNPSEGMHHAKSAIVSLRQIKPNDNLCVELVT